MGGVRVAMEAWASEIRDLLLPRGCAGCDRPDYALCPHCASEFHQYATWRESASGLTCHACASYRGFARHAVLSWKDHDDLELDAAFAQFMAELVPACGVVTRLRSGGPPADSTGPVLVVPAPSSFTSMSRRGRNHTLPLARAVAEALSACGIEACAVEALRMRGVRSKAVQTSSGAARSSRLAGHISVVHARSLAGARVILVDDIITSGATIRQCAQAIEQASGTVVSACALAHTPAPGHQTS